MTDTTSRAARPAANKRTVLTTPSGRAGLLRCKRVLVGLWTSALLLGQPVLADEIVMQNGDRLSGNILQQTGNAILLETSYAGQIRLSVDEIKKVTFAGSRTLILNRESPIDVVSVERVEEKLRVVLADSAEAIETARGSLSSPTAGTADSGVATAFSGRLDLTFKREDGNTEKTEVDLDYLLTYRRPGDRLRSEGMGEFDTRTGVRSKQDWSISGQYDHFLEERLYTGITLTLKQEKFADLDLRTVVGPLIGYQFIESPQQNLLGEFAVLYLDENYSGQPRRSSWGPGWRIRYDRYLFGDSLQFYHNEFGFLSTKDTGKLVWTAFTGLRMPLLLGFVASTEMEFDYDGSPAIAAQKLDTTLRFKIGYVW
jgi:hypothetical protein